MGFTGNYLDRGDVVGFLASLASSGHPVTVFHPLRVTDGIRVPALEANNEDRLVNGLLGSGVLSGDGRRLARRVTGVFGRVAAGAHIRLVLHTEYYVPLWCCDGFRRAYVSAVSSVVGRVESARPDDITVEYVVEMHPGFTGLRLCRSSGYRLACRRVERDVGRLSECVRSFREELLGSVESLGIRDVRFTIEPRAGSAVHVAGKEQHQTVCTYGQAISFAKRNGLGLVVDPAQTTYRSASVRSAWAEVVRAVSDEPDVVDEVHVHSPGSRGGRGHGLPSEEDMRMYEIVITKALRARRDTALGAVLEVLNAKTYDLLRIANALLDIARRERDGTGDAGAKPT